MAGELVLIVDDNERNLRLARDVLMLGGFRTVEASTGGEGVAAAVEHRPAVILMDIRLPDMDGIDPRRGADVARHEGRPGVAAVTWVRRVPREADQRARPARSGAGLLLHRIARIRA